MQVDMYLAASPPLFSPLMGPLDVTTGRSASSSLYTSRRPFTSSYRTRTNQPTLSSLGFDFDLSAMTLSPAIIRTAAESTLFGRRANQRLPGLQVRANKMATPIFGTAPLRSCLVKNGQLDTEPSSPVSSDEETSPIRKKRVVFADDKGLSLTQIKMMTEPSDCPPRWTAEFLEQVTGGASAEVAADRWEMTFAQPASDYLEFRSRLDKQNVSLENVVVQEADQQLVGTVKVKNLSFSKQVTVRVTLDNWATQTDVEATFSPCGLLQGSSASASNGPINLFDTFSFKVPIAASVPSNRIQFCLRFTCDAGEFWDNNCGKNYVIVKPELAAKRNSPTRPSTRRVTSGKYSDLLSPGSKVDYWSDFASWNHLVNDSPYW